MRVIFFPEFCTLILDIFPQADRQFEAEKGRRKLKRNGRKNSGRVTLGFCVWVTTGRAGRPACFMENFDEILLNRTLSHQIVEDNSGSPSKGRCFSPKISLPKKCFSVFFHVISQDDDLTIFFFVEGEIVSKIFRSPSKMGAGTEW